MKRHGHLFEKIVSKKNLMLALEKASRGKRNKPAVMKAIENPEETVSKLQDMLLNGTYKTSRYHMMTIYEPKERLIYILPFYPDRIIHHAIVNILEPLWDKIFIPDSYSCRKGKGQHKGSNRCMEFARHYKYVLKCDISKFYPSCNHELLKEIIREKIKDRRVLNLLDEIIDSVEGETNVPIGNYLSQWFGNLIMNRFDMYVKHELHCKGYIRYCDDFVLFSNSKAELNDWKEKVTEFLKNMKFKLSKCSIFPVSQGIDFLGYRHFKNRILVRKSTLRNIKKRMNAIIDGVESGWLYIDTAIGQVASAKGWVKHAQSKNLLKKLHIKELEEYLRVRRYTIWDDIDDNLSKTFGISSYRERGLSFSDEMRKSDIQYQREQQKIMKEKFTIKDESLNESIS